MTEDEELIEVEVSDETMQMLKDYMEKRGLESPGEALTEITKILRDIDE